MGRTNVTITPRRTEVSTSRVSGFVTRAERAVSHPLVSYALIAALQLRVIWNVWKYKDLTYGDTSNYFINAASWMHGLHDNVVYSPLYSAAWGTILAIVHDVYAAAMVNRIAIVFAAAMLFLAAMRAVLPPAIALLIALW